MADGRGRPGSSLTIIAMALALASDHQHRDLAGCMTQGSGWPWAANGPQPAAAARCAPGGSGQPQSPVPCCMLGRAAGYGPLRLVRPRRAGPWWRHTLRRAAHRLGRQVVRDGVAGRSPPCSLLSAPLRGHRQDPRGAATCRRRGQAPWPICAEFIRGASGRAREQRGAGVGCESSPPASGVASGARLGAQTSPHGRARRPPARPRASPQVSWRTVVQPWPATGRGLRGGSAAHPRRVRRPQRAPGPDPAPSRAAKWQTGYTGQAVPGGIARSAAGLPKPAR